MTSNFTVYAEVGTRWVVVLIQRALMRNCNHQCMPQEREAKCKERMKHGREARRSVKKYTMKRVLQNSVDHLCTQEQRTINTANELSCSAGGGGDVMYLDRIVRKVRLRLATAALEPAKSYEK
jgi:hypothetical protein